MSGRERGAAAADANTPWARAFVDELHRAGVREVSVAPGSRSTPLVLAVDRDGRFRTFVHLDERSAAFFALGVGKASGRPAAVLTTSGTAVANLWPAVVEAARAEVPLLLLTADRPHRLRGADANQAIDQIGLFGRYVRSFVDVAPPSPDPDALRHLRVQACRAVADALGLPAGPVHLNFPFAKPLEPASGAVESRSDVEARPDGTPRTRVGVRRPAAADGELRALAAFLEEAARPLLVAGPHPEPARLGAAVRTLASATGVPVLADPLSGARHGSPPPDPPIPLYDPLLGDPALRRHLAPDRVLRVGRSPTSASLATLLEECGAEQVVVDPGDLWKDHGLTANRYVRADAPGTLEVLARRVRERAPEDWRDTWRAVQEAAAKALAGELAGEAFEGTVAAGVVEALPAGATLFVSSSMPVRDVDAFGGGRTESLSVLGNRGASGIDGTVSTALGVAGVSGGPTVALLGDLALVHDMNGLLATREPGVECVFVVVNNDGGGIFHLLPVREHEPAFTRYFATPHGLDFRHAAALYDLPYERVDAAGVGPALRRALERGGSALLEVRTDREANRRRRAAVVDAVVRAATIAMSQPRRDEGA